LIATGVVAGVALGEAIVGEGEGGALGAGLDEREGGALGEEDGALADCRQDATTSRHKLEMNTNGWRWATARV
jgi:hypothetical protein